MVATSADPSLHGIFRSDKIVSHVNDGFTGAGQKPPRILRQVDAKRKAHYIRSGADHGLFELIRTGEVENRGVFRAEGKVDRTVGDVGPAKLGESKQTGGN